MHCHVHVHDRNQSQTSKIILLLTRQSWSKYCLRISILRAKRLADMTMQNKLNYQKLRVNNEEVYVRDFSGIFPRKLRAKSAIVLILHALFFNFRMCCIF